MFRNAGVFQPRHRCLMFQGSGAAADGADGADGAAADTADDTDAAAVGSALVAYNFARPYIALRAVGG
jgi:hypothetical protein